MPAGREGKTCWIAGTAEGPVVRERKPYKEAGTTGTPAVKGNKGCRAAEQACRVGEQGCRPAQPAGGPADRETGGSARLSQGVWLLQHAGKHAESVLGGTLGDRDAKWHSMQRACSASRG